MSDKIADLQNLPVNELLKKHPDLVKEAAVIQAAEAKFTSNIEDPRVLALAMQDVRADVAARMERGEEMPEVSVVQSKPKASAGAVLEREIETSSLAQLIEKGQTKAQKQLAEERERGGFEL